MELTLKRLLEQAEFTETRKGYDRGQVDDFLDKAVAMATKVEARLTQALDQAKASGAATGPSVGEIEAEVDRRVQARLAEMPPAADTAASEEEAAEQVRRTLVLAQRTADAAVREAREDAAKLLADAQERAANLNAETEAAFNTAQADLNGQIESERRTARERLSGEIGELEGAREALRTDVTVLERHVEEQRSQLASTIGELQRLLDDPAGFRLAPSPVLLEPTIPDLDEPAPDAVAEAPASAAPAPAPAADAPAAESPAPDAASVAAAVPGPVAFEPPTAPEAEAPAPPELSFEEVDHAAPGIDEQPDSGPPTMPVSAVDLGVAQPLPTKSGRQEPDPGEEDAFLTELRKAMADDEPLGPRDHSYPPSPSGMLEDDDDRRGWRFGKRR